MDKVIKYRTVIKNILTELAEISNRRPVPGVETSCVFDDEHGHYMLAQVGWSNGKRVRHTTLYFRIRNEKIWIEENWTDLTFEEEFEEAGIPKEDIVIGFYSPEKRMRTEYAVA